MKLLPCPFCAREPEVVVFDIGSNETKKLYSVSCLCGAESPKDSKSELGAARIWNRRRHLTRELFRYGVRG